MNKKDKIQAVIFDWAGTTVDYGCLAPVKAFIEAFKLKGIELTDKEVRGPMGLNKIDHIKAICELERVKKLWVERFGAQPQQNDILDIYADFELRLLKILGKYSEVISGVPEVVEKLREAGIKIGSSTGYTAEMAEIIQSEAGKKGYQPDSVLTAEDVPQGRPAPYMCYQNAINLEVYPLDRIVKVGDTVSDIKAGVNAGVWSVGVIEGSSELGLSKEEVKEFDTKLLKTKKDKVRKRYQQAGADYVIDKIVEINDVIEEINQQLSEEAM